MRSIGPQVGLHVATCLPRALLASCLQIPMPLPEGRVYSHLAFGPPGSDLLAASYEVREMRRIYQWTWRTADDVMEEGMG